MSFHPARKITNVSKLLWRHLRALLCAIVVGVLYLLSFISIVFGAVFSWLARDGVDEAPVSQGIEALLHFADGYLGFFLFSVCMLWAALLIRKL